MNHHQGIILCGVLQRQERHLNFTGLGLGLIFGAVIGAAAFASNFCALGAVADLLFARDSRRLRAWMLAAGAAILGTQGLAVAGLVLPPIGVLAGSWPMVAAGGVLFGYGMALAGGCLNRALVRIGAGSVKSLAVIAVATVAAVLTARLLPGRPLAVLIPSASGDVQAAGGLLAGGVLVAYALADSWFRRGRIDVAASALIGLCIPLVWAASRAIHQPAAVNFVESLSSLGALFGGHMPRSSIPLGLLVGVPLGSFAVAASTRSLGLDTYIDWADLARHIAGAALMGVGGVLALGDTFGQGLSGFAALSLAAVVAVASMGIGCLWGIRSFEAGGVWGGLKLTVALLVKRRP